MEPPLHLCMGALQDGPWPTLCSVPVEGMKLLCDSCRAAAPTHSPYGFTFTVDQRALEEDRVLFYLKVAILDERTQTGIIMQAAAVGHMRVLEALLLPGGTPSTSAGIIQPLFHALLIVAGQPDRSAQGIELLRKIGYQPYFGDPVSVLGQNPGALARYVSYASEKTLSTLPRTVLTELLAEPNVYAREIRRALRLRSMDVILRADWELFGSYLLCPTLTQEQRDWIPVKTHAILARRRAEIETELSLVLPSDLISFIFRAV